MLVALSIKNFKSIEEARVRFGALTCVIGHNGVGKSNLFDAIHFLSLLSDRDIYRAAVEVRRTSDGSHSPLDLIFGRDPSRKITLSADMIVPREVTDDFGVPTHPSTTLLTYELTLAYDPASDRLLVAREFLAHAKLGDYRSFTAFRSKKEFQATVAVGSRRGGPLISTDGDRIMLHGDGGSRGRPAPVGTSPLTVVGGTNTADYPTVLAAKREMSSWRLLHLEPSAMRTPDARAARPHVTAAGGHLAATLRALTSTSPDIGVELVNRLRELNSDVVALDAYADDARDQLALRARVRGVDSWLFGRSLSDGTLRYIALALMLVDVEDRGVLCIEEPENGMHPSRVQNLLRLLYEYAVDLEEPVGSDNPLRQVVLNTHSPEVARQVSFDDILFAEHALRSDGTSRSVFLPIEGTWRVDADGGPTKDRRAVVDFIGGSPPREDLRQLELRFGTAS
ncbi:MAG: AAA family ATPase [Sandaracinaceae bacterium]|nr:AAA family ATPase [Sandaracinaceae bacterium]